MVFNPIVPKYVSYTKILYQPMLVSSWVFARACHVLGIPICIGDSIDGHLQLHNANTLQSHLLPICAVTKSLKFRSALEVTIVALGE